MTINRKPRAFIGSSREAIPYARAIAEGIEMYIEVNAWYANTFQANDYTMESLERELDANDFGIFVFAAEDVATIRNQTYFVTRDNTLFEMGLFGGGWDVRESFVLFQMSSRLVKRVTLLLYIYHPTWKVLLY